MNAPAPQTSADRKVAEVPPLWQIEFHLAELTSKQAGIPRHCIRSDSRLLEDLHIDSLDMVELILSVEEQFGVSIPDDIGQQMFVRQPVTIAVLAEIVQRQWGTGTPERKSWFAKKTAPPRMVGTPFTQLGGTVSENELWAGPLYEPMADTPQGFRQLRRRTDGMRCVLIPEAEVELGSDAAVSLPDQRPVHHARISSFLIDAEPVSVQAFARFLNSTEVSAETISSWCGVGSDDRRGRHFQLGRRGTCWQPLPETGQQPVILVSWFGANAYALWANRCEPGRVQGEDESPCFLPSEAQWEYAARGPKSRLFPWGNEAATMERAQIALHTARTRYEGILPLADVADRLGMSPFGLHHMAGNVWQWCADWYSAEFYRLADARQSDPRNSRPTGVRSERGGSWIGPGNLAQSSYRRGRPPAARGRCLGFRCVGRTVDLPN